MGGRSANRNHAIVSDKSPIHSLTGVGQFSMSVIAWFRQLAPLPSAVKGIMISRWPFDCVLYISDSKRPFCAASSLSLPRALSAKLCANRELSRILLSQREVDLVTLRTANYFFVPPGGGGMEISRVVTGPNDERGLSKSADFPTTRIASWFLWTYFFATRATSSCVTFSIPLR